jgi:D-threonine aldolase
MSTDWWTIENPDDVPTPALLVYPDRIDTNLDKMIEWSGDVTRLRPHVKTHKLAEIVAMKLAKGITKFKTATIAESEMVATAGGRDILLAMQPVGKNFHRYLALMDRFPTANFMTVVDEEAHLDWMCNVIESSGHRLRLFIDLNVGMNRTGIEWGDGAMALYRKLCRYSQLPQSRIEVAGIHAYDGHLHIPDADELAHQSASTFGRVIQMRDELRTEGYPVPTIVTSGTPTSPLVAARHEPDVEVSAGTTVLWDFGQQITCPNMTFLNAAILMARVVSRPTKDRICIDLGHKSVASEFPQPRVRLFGLEDAVPVVHSEEHLVLETPRASEMPVGSIVYGIPKHICPTVALHSHAWVVRDGRVGEAWRVTARDRILSI